MIGALFTGITGLSSQQTALDNEANNIANVNTVGFKASRISFADQMYQDRVGKGSKILDAEKLYKQGSLKITGVAYDMALNGEGFFTVKNSNTNENMFTRVGNFRMGDNGTLQDAAGNEVQGWMMVDIDPRKDVTSTNPNVEVFTNDYNKLLASKIIKHSTYVETITAKATDYNSTAVSDSETVYSGAGFKTKSAKISDVEEAIKDYTNWLQKLSQEPDGASATSTAQVSQINYKTGDNALVSKEGDQIYVYINGNKYSQNYVNSSASQAQMEELYAYDQTLAAADQFGFTDPSGALSEAQQAQYDIAVSRIETYKALSDKISQIPGLQASMVKEIDGSGTFDAFDESDKYEDSTKLADMIYGIIEIKSLIPGQEFTISEVAEVSGSSVIQGNYQTSTFALAGSGIGALNSSSEALSRLITGNQRDAYTITDLKFDKSPMFSYSITIYDKELRANIPVPNDGGTPPQALPIYINATDTNGEFTIDAFINSFNESLDNNGNVTSPKITDYVEAKNINGNLVIQTLDDNYDVEFSPLLKQLPTYTVNLNEVVDNSTYTFNLDVNGSTYPITIDYSTTDSLTNSVEYQNIRDYLETQINNINSLNPDYQLAVTEQINGVFSIYTKNKDISFLNSSENIVDNLPTVSPLTINTLTTPNVTYEKDKISVEEPLLNQVYSFQVMGETITYDNTTGTATSADDIINSFKTQINSNPNLTPYLSVADDTNSMGTPGDGVVLTNGLNNTPVRYSSLSEGRFMIEIPAGTSDLTLYLDEMTQDDTFQVFTKSGKHIAGTALTDDSWKSGNTPENIVKDNLGTYFNSDAVYSDELLAPSISNTYYGPYNSPDGNSNTPTSSTVATYVDKNGVTQNINISEHEELVVIPNVSEDLVVFVNGTGAYYVAAEWGSVGGVSAGSSSLVLTQENLQDPNNPSGLDITNLSGVVDNDIEDFTYTARFEHRFTIDTDDTKSASIYTIGIEGKTFEIKTDQTPTMTEILDLFNAELEKDFETNLKFELSLDGNDIVIQERYSDYGYVGFSQNSTLDVRSLTYPGDEYKTLITKASSLYGIDSNKYFSGRAGAGAEYLEMFNRVDQTASKGSLQLRLDTNKISDSAFGEFSVDSSGLIMMKQDGANFAIGQIAIAMFNNNRGLNPVGDNLLEKTTQSGEAFYNLNNEKTAKIEAKTLELSSADLSESLVNLMVFQRAFEANAKSITTSDQLLNTLINLKR